MPHVLSCPAKMAWLRLERNYLSVWQMNLAQNSIHRTLKCDATAILLVTAALLSRYFCGIRAMVVYPCDIHCTQGVSRGSILERTDNWERNSVHCDDDQFWIWPTWKPFRGQKIFITNHHRTNNKNSLLLIFVWWKLEIRFKKLWTKM